MLKVGSGFGGKAVLKTAAAKPLALAIGSPAQTGPATRPLYPAAISRLEAPRPKRKYASSTRKIAFQQRAVRAFPGISL